VPDRDTDLRAAALSHVAALQLKFGVLSRARISEGFEFRGERIFLAGKARGIFKPRQMQVGALSIKTTVPREGRERRYDDQINNEAQPYFLYRYQGSDPDATDNRNLRDSMRLSLPIIYFYGVDEAHYDPLICVVSGEDPTRKSFQVAPYSNQERPAGAALLIERRYTMAEVRRRLHQRKFSRAVLQAYEERCAICRLRHLLDAAHIVADVDKLGEARVPNGLALCKLHHAAFDAHLLGISPDLNVHVSRELLEEKDGPMLEHGLRAFDGARLVLPRDRDDHPDCALIALRWDSFRAA
jgi:putative restriction endonuclease